MNQPFAIVIAGLLFGSTGFAQAQVVAQTEGASSRIVNDLAGEWVGTWKISQNYGELMLQVPPEGMGTLAATNVPRFGTSPAALTAFEQKGREVSFSAIGADGGSVSATLKLTSDQKKMTGWAHHGSSTVWFELRRK